MNSEFNPTANIAEQKCSSCNNGGNQKAVSGLKEKFNMNKHAAMGKVLNQFLNTARAISENYAEVKKLGETVLPICLSIPLFLRQAQLTKIDSQIIMMNSEFNPTANIAEQKCSSCKANNKKFQHNGTAEAIYHLHVHRRPG